MKYYFALFGIWIRCSQRFYEFVCGRMWVMTSFK